MQFTKFAVIASLAAAASAWTNETWVTTTVDVYTTVCPYATSLTFNGQTYTATAVCSTLLPGEKIVLTRFCYSPRQSPSPTAHALSAISQLSPP